MRLRFGSIRPILILIGCSILLAACHRQPPTAQPQTTPEAPPQYLLRRALAAELMPLPQDELGSLASLFDDEAVRTDLEFGPTMALPARLDLLNQHFFGPSGYAALQDYSGPEGISVASVMRNRRGACVGLAIVYLALAERLGLDAHAVATPDHVFVRVRLDGRARNVELLESGREVDDDIYRRRHKVDPSSVEAGVFLRDLTHVELIAHLMTNQGVELSKQSKIEDAVARYDEALQLAPKLSAAWYNRGIDLMNLDRLDDALSSFNRAIGLHPLDAQAHNNRGLAKYKLGDVEGARRDWMRALELHPGLKEAEANLKRLTEAAVP